MGMFSAMGSSIGAIGQGIGAYQGMKSNRSTLNQGAQRAQDTLAAGRQEARGDFSPFMQAGTQAVGDYSNLVGASGNIQGPNQSESFNFNDWNNPSANYSLQQSNATLQNSALAKGGLGGGLARALSENATNMANQNYQNAFANYNTNANRVFGQQQQQYTNQNQQQQQKITNTGNIAQMGLGATGTYSGLASGYNKAIADNIYGNAENQAQVTSHGYGQMGDAFNTANTQAGSAADQSPWGRMMNMGGS